MVEFVRSDPPPKTDNKFTGYRAGFVEKARSDPGNWYEVIRSDGKGWSQQAGLDWKHQFPDIETTTRVIEGLRPTRVRLWIRAIVPDAMPYS